MMTYANSPNSWFTDFPIVDVLTQHQKLDSWLVGKLIKFGPHPRINGCDHIDMGTFIYLEKELMSRGWSLADARRTIHKAVRGPARSTKSELRLDLS